MRSRKPAIAWQSACGNGIQPIQFPPPAGGTGPFGFIEPCSIGSSLIFIKYLEGKQAARKLAETTTFYALIGMPYPFGRAGFPHVIDRTVAGWFKRGARRRRARPHLRPELSARCRGGIHPGAGCSTGSPPYWRGCPFLAGVIVVALGLWSIWLGGFALLPEPT